MEKLSITRAPEHSETQAQEERFSQDFRDRYERQGMEVSINDSLHSDLDTTLLFSNSTMFRFKEAIRDNQLPASGIAAQQLCLRTPDLSSYDKEGYVFNHPSLFNMVGLITPKEFTDTIFTETYDWLISIGISPERIYIKTASDDLLANNVIPEGAERVLINTENPSFYQWDYGVEGLAGEGITFSILQQDGEILDVGNIIAFVDAERNLIGWESAFGIETLTARRDNVPLYKKHLMFEIFGEITNEQQKPLLDSLGSVAELISQGYKPGPKKQEYIVRKYLNIIFRLSNKLSINIDPLVIKYCSLKGHAGEETLHKIKEYIGDIETKREVNVKNFTRYLNRHRELTNEEKIVVAKSSFSLELEDIESLV